MVSSEAIALPLTETAPVTYSIVLPVYNEEACLSAVVKRIISTQRALGHPFEVICVDDGSHDASWAIIAHLNENYPEVKGVRFSRNFGHQKAFYAGIEKASGKYVALLDADGQDPPEVLPDFFRKLEDENLDVVYAIRRKRKEGIFKRSAYALFYRFYKSVVPFDVPLDSGDFAVFTQDVASFMRKLPEKRPFLRGLRSWYGGKQVGLEYERDKRLAGPPKYTFTKLVLLALNASISFSKAPLRVISVSGVIISALSFVFAIGLVALRFASSIEIAGWTSTAVLIIFFGGLNLFVLGIIGEYIGDIFDEVKNRPSYLEKDTIGF